MICGAKTEKNKSHQMILRYFLPILNIASKEISQLRSALSGVASRFSMMRSPTPYFLLIYTFVLIAGNLIMLAGCGGGGGGTPEGSTITVNSGDSFETKFEDTFNSDSLDAYTVADTLTTGGTGTVSYENESLRINTGKDIGISISHSLPALNAGIFEIDFRPLVKYPDGGRVYIRLWAGRDSYYELYNTDGYGAKGISKYVGGKKVDSAEFLSEYEQGNNYIATISFRPESTTVVAFGDVVVMNGDTTSLTVNRLEVELIQQDAYVDNIYYDQVDTDSPVVVNRIPPTWDNQVGICSAEDAAIGRSVTVNFGAATDDISEGSVKYNIYYAPTTDWNSHSWFANNVISNIAPTAGIVCLNAYRVTGLTNDVEYTFGVRVTDESGNEDSNTTTRVAIPSDEGLITFSDDFSTDSRDEYTVSDTLTTGGTGAFLFESQRLQIITGNEIGLSISRSVTEQNTGILQLDFWPLVKYPAGGRLYIRLWAGTDNYYELYNTDGYGPKGISKYVGGQKVDEAEFKSGYGQGKYYTITFRYSPGATTVEAFGEQLVMDSDSTALNVNRVELELVQQDAYLDNIMVSAQPYVTIITPQSYDLKISPNLAVRAMSGNLQTGWGVSFNLQDLETKELKTITDFTEPFEYSFNELLKHEHTAEALIIDSNSNPIGGEFAFYVVSPVGIGDYYVAFGDSITDGDEDNISWDNLSQDLRDDGQGYPPILNDLLTAAKGFPHTVVNEGVGGEKSIDGLARIQSVMDAHPDAKYFLILFGTNDSGGTLPVPSGLDANGLLLNPTDPGYNGSFLDNMQKIVNAVYAAGKLPILAKVPIALGPCSSCVPFVQPETASRNLLIQKYNVVIDALVARNSIGVVPPDFYNYFRQHQDEFGDNLHPNGSGYQSMARLWFDALKAGP